MTTLTVFVSHSSADEALARAVRSCCRRPCIFRRVTFVAQASTAINCRSVRTPTIASARRFFRLKYFLELSHHLALRLCTCSLRWVRGGERTGIWHRYWLAAATPISLKDLSRQ